MNPELLNRQTNPELLKRRLSRRDFGKYEGQEGQPETKEECLSPKADMEKKKMCFLPSSSGLIPTYVTCLGEGHLTSVILSTSFSYPTQHTQDSV